MAGYWTDLVGKAPLFSEGQQVRIKGDTKKYLIKDVAYEEGFFYGLEAIGQLGAISGFMNGRAQEGGLELVPKEQMFFGPPPPSSYGIKCGK